MISFTFFAQNLIDYNYLHLKRMSLADRLNYFKKETYEICKAIDEYGHESSFDRTRREIQHKLAESEKYRASVLRNVATFAGLSSDAITSAAQCMDEVYFKKGDTIIEQDDFGDTFFVIEEGLVSIRRKANMKDKREEPKELAQLSRNQFFGEIALMTTEPRSASVVVLSNTCKCLTMTKGKFDELLATTNKLHAENRRLIGKDVLDTVPLFESLSTSHKSKLLDVMLFVTFLPNTYICRHGTAGNTFYIITGGTCKVTINREDRSEMEVATLRPGDFFGEVALVEVSNKRTANVIASEPVNCLSLSRTDFNRLLGQLKVKLVASHGGAGDGSNIGGKSAGINDAKRTLLAKKRRVCGLDIHGHKDENRMLSLFKRFSKFTSESLWDNLYGRLYRETLLDSNKILEYGPLMAKVMQVAQNRREGVEEIRKQIWRILRCEHTRRHSTEHLMVYATLKQRNSLRDVLCKNWPVHQYKGLCRKVTISTISQFQKIFEVGSEGTCAFLILRGCVRIFNKMSGDATSTRVYYEEDLVPGDVFGEGALNGVHVRTMTAQAITNVDLAVIDDTDYLMAQDRDSVKLSVDDRLKFLANVPLFKNIEKFKLSRFANALVQEEINKGAMLTSHGQQSRDLYFVLSGRIEVLTNLKKKHAVITTLMKYDIFGESGLINKYTKTSHHKVAEDMHTIACTRVEVLVIHEHNYHYFDMESLELIKQAFLAKQEWRRERVLLSKAERACARGYIRRLQLETAEAAQRIERIVTPSMSTSTSAEGANEEERDKDAAKERMEDIHEIPYILLQDFNPMMLTSTVKKEKDLVVVKSIIAELRRPKSARLAHRHAIAQQQQEEDNQSNGRRFMTRRSTFESTPLIVTQPENNFFPVQDMNQGSFDGGESDGRRSAPSQCPQLQREESRISRESNQPSSAHALRLQPQPLPYLSPTNQPSMDHLQEQLSRYNAQDRPPLLKGSSKVPMTSSSSHFERVFLMEKERKEIVEKEGKSFKNLRSRIIR